MCVCVCVCVCVWAEFYVNKFQKPSSFTPPNWTVSIDWSCPLWRCLFLSVLSNSFVYWPNDRTDGKVTSARQWPWRTIPSPNWSSIFGEKCKLNRFTSVRYLSYFSPGSPRSVSPLLGQFRWDRAKKETVTICVWSDPKKKRRRNCSYGRIKIPKRCKIKAAWSFGEPSTALVSWYRLTLSACFICPAREKDQEVGGLWVGRLVVGWQR